MCPDANPNHAPCRESQRLELYPSRYVEREGEGERVRARATFKSGLALRERAPDYGGGGLDRVCVRDNPGEGSVYLKAVYAASYVVRLRARAS